jgi:hypothetical protein
MTDPTDALLGDTLAVPGLTAEVALGPGASIQAGWRTNGIPLLTADRTGCLPMLTITSGRSRLVIGFPPHEDLEPEHAELAELLATEAGALAAEVSLLAGGEATDLVNSRSVAVPEDSAFTWVNHVHLRPGRTYVKMQALDGDVPWLDIISGDDGQCSVGFDAEQVQDLHQGHLAVLGEFAAAARAFARDVRAVVDATAMEPDSES